MMSKFASGRYVDIVDTAVFVCVTVAKVTCERLYVQHTVVMTSWNVVIRFCYYKRTRCTYK